MWLLPSKNRPKECGEALQAFRQFGSTPGVLWVDGDPEGYDQLELPEGWSIRYGNAGIAGSMRWLYENHPQLEWYGWMADDMRPASDRFDLRMIEECEGLNFVYCNGGGHKTPQHEPESPWDAPRSIPSAMVWGRRLIECVGWWVPPWIERTCIDEVWKHLARDAGIARYRHDAVVRHLHWTTGGRPKDLVDHEGMNGSLGDQGRMNAWFQSDEYQELIRKIVKTFGSGDERRSVWRKHTLYKSRHLISY